MAGQVEPVTPVVTDARWALVERICASTHLQRSARLRELLHYLCRRAWSEGCEEIREHEIAVAVFGRPDQYDSAQDTIVRVQASQLRKRLERYFAEEGRSEPLIVNIPRGAYLPVVRERETASAATPAEPRAHPARLVRFLAALCALLALTCGWLVYRQMKPVSPYPNESLRRFWSAFSSNDRETFVVLADSSFAALQDALQRPVTMEEYVRRSYTEDFNRADLPAQYRDLLRYLMARRYTSLADVLVVRRLSEAALLPASRTRIVYARDHNVRAFHTANHILIGSQRAIPWVNLFTDAMDFHINDNANAFGLSPDRNPVVLRVENRRPQNGEPSTFIAQRRDGKGSESFSLIAFLPNLARTGHVLILAGSEMSATETAGDLVTTGAVADLLRRLPRQSGGGIPYFEALLKTRHVEGTSRGFEIAALHLH